MKVICRPVLLCLLLLATFVSACGPLPRPFMRSEKTVTNPLVEKGIPADVAVNPVAGTSIPMAKLLAQAVVDEIILYDIVSYPDDKGSSKYVLDGRVEMNADVPAGTAERQIKWVLSTRDGKSAGVHYEPVGGTAFEWDYGSPKLIREIGEHTANAVAKMMLGTGVKIQTDTPRLTGVWVKPISDAPGDGNFSLTRAIAFALGDAGIVMVRNKEQAAHILKGRVRLDSPESGQQKVEIIWTMTDQDGKEIGQARQRNRVPAGTFDGRWGQSAVMISMAAVGGIQDILVAQQNKPLNVGKQPLSTTLSSSDSNSDELIPPPSLIPQ